VTIPSSRARLAGILHGSFCWTTALFVVVILIVRPWGDFPLNDDWQYARVTKALAETGRFQLDVKIAPSLVAQAYLAAPFVRLFGFSHTLLRLLTMALALVLLRAIDRILTFGGASRPVRLLGSTLLIVNPIFLNVALSFMTEIWGYVLALSAAWIWFAERTRRGDRVGEPIVSWRTGMLVALLVGASFWVRQFCVAVFLPLWLASVLARLLRCDWRSVVRSLPAAVTSCSCFAGLVFGYFYWARASGNYRPEFHSRLEAVWRFDSRVWWLTGFEMAVYLTAFLGPLLMCFARWRRVRWGWLVGSIAAIACLIWRGKQLLPEYASLEHHVDFPYAANLIFNAGVGPLTLTPTYFAVEPGPQWPTPTWRVVELVLLGLTFAWSLWFARPRPHDTARLVVTEMRLFAVLFGALAFALNVQAYHRNVFDRYYFPCVIAALIALGTSFQGRSACGAPGYAARVRAGLVGLLLLPLAWFAIGGVHDYFRWNHARWKLVSRALAEVPPSHLDGGFEVNGWLNYDEYLRGVQPTDCLGPCGCSIADFLCSDDSYQISFALVGDRDAVEGRRPSYWLWRRGDVVLTRRRVRPPARDSH
jgi:hypothetical protein